MITKIRHVVIQSNPHEIGLIMMIDEKMIEFGQIREQKVNGRCRNRERSESNESNHVSFRFKGIVIIVRETIMTIRERIIITLL